MTAIVKICGIKTEAALDAALDGGADYIGLVFYPRSPRHVEAETARLLAERVRGRGEVPALADRHAEIVALAVDPSDAALDAIVEAACPDVIQLHGNETPERVREIAPRFEGRVLKAIKVETADDVDRARAYEGAARILFDAKPPPGALPGGNGAAFDWRLLSGAHEFAPYFMLSGGLNPQNVAEAILVTGAAAVDVSSGVETRPGEKDPELIRRFIRAAKTGKQGA